MTSEGFDDDSEIDLSPSVENLLAATSLRWIFVGGKGGVGKTTSSCSLGVLFAAVRSSVLIISTDPAHNLSDAFCQKFTSQPTLVNGFENLYCMEVEASSSQLTDALNLGGANDPNLDDSIPSANDSSGGSAGGGGIGSLMKDIGGIGSSFPGIDETLSFLEIMKSVKNMEYELIIFDTAPTGHTLRLLRFPTVLKDTFDKVLSLKSRFGGLFNTFSSMFMGGNNPNSQEMKDSMLGKFEEMKETIEEVTVMFSNPAITTFVCVCIPEFLSLYETERLIQELTKYQIDTHNIIVNQVLFFDSKKTLTEDGEVNDCDGCRKLKARKKMQDKYLENIYELYGDEFNITVLPITDDEVRGTDRLRAFSKNYLVPYQQKQSTQPTEKKQSTKEKVVEFICEQNGLDITTITEQLKESHLL